jgi:hypothetical protein
VRETFQASRRQVESVLTPAQQTTLTQIRHRRLAPLGPLGGTGIDPRQRMRPAGQAMPSPRGAFRRQSGAMKTFRTFKGSWFALAVVLAILIGEIAAWKLSPLLGRPNNPFLVGVLSVAAVAFAASILFRDADYD